MTGMRTTLPLRRRLSYEAWRLRFKFNRRFRPIKIAPEYLSGYDGDPPYWLRADLAKRPADVPAALAKVYGIPVEDLVEDYMSDTSAIVIVWSREAAVTDPGYEEGEQWESCDKDAEGAVPFWHWSES